MDFALIALVAAGASALTLFSGFGLGTLLLPAFALFLPAPQAVAATGIVHLANNLFKGTLLRQRADWPTVWRFGLPAVPAAIAGAWALAWLGDTPRLFVWTAFGRVFGPTGASVTVGIVLIVFALLELQPWFRRLKAPPRAMPLGGVLTGFLGGLTGQQGALRSIFLLRGALSADRFVATGVMIALLVDLSRIATYVARFDDMSMAGRQGALTLVGMAAAITGATVATRRIDKVTIGGIRGAVAALMLAIGLAMIAGLLGA
jgi:uncharacterized membrane protein YfcA